MGDDSRYNLLINIRKILFHQSINLFSGQKHIVGINELIDFVYSFLGGLFLVETADIFCLVAGSLNDGGGVNIEGVRGQDKPS